MTKTKRASAVFCAFLLIPWLLGACGGKPVERAIGGISLGEHKVIASVNGEDIYEDDYMEWYLETMTLSLGLDMSGEQDEQVASFLEDYKFSYLVGYAEQIALLQEARKDGLGASDEDAEEYRTQIKLMYNADDDYFASLLAMWGFTDDTFKKYLKEQITLQLLYTNATENITEPTMSPEEYYRTNPDEFQVDETRTVRHILVDTQEEADEIIASLNEGADFDTLVAERSTDPGAQINGGSYGPFDASGVFADGSGSLVEPFTEAAFALEEPGDITQRPAETEFGYHILILDEITMAHTLPFEEVKDDLAAHLLNDAKEQYFNEYYERIMDGAEFTYAEGIPQY